MSEQNRQPNAPKQPQFTVALFQQDIVWEQPQANWQKVQSAFAQAIESRRQVPDMLVVPETFTTGFGDQMARQAEPPLGPTFEFALSMAKRYNALFCGTWTVKDKGLVFNRLHCVRPDGTYAFYDKGHTFRMSSEASQLARGQMRVMLDWRGWRIQLAVCYDLRFPLWLRNSPSLDYDLLLVCANWPGSRHEAWSTLLKARAIENLAYVVGCNRTGTDGTGITYAGCSAIIDYKGLPLDEAGLGNETVSFATLDAQRLQTFRSHWPFNVDFDPFTLLSDDLHEGEINTVLYGE